VELITCRLYFEAQHNLVSNRLIIDSAISKMPGFLFLFSSITGTSIHQRSGSDDESKTRYGCSYSITFKKCTVDHQHKVFSLFHDLDLEMTIKKINTRKGPAEWHDRMCAVLKVIYLCVIFIGFND